MKTISSKHLRDTIAAGWAVEDIEKPKPKKPPEKLTRDIVAETLWTIKTMADSISACFRAQGNALNNIKVEMPEPRKDKKRNRRLKVVRDKKDLIDYVDIVEL